jgi:hypothetical protein
MGGLTVSQSGLTTISGKIGDAPKRKVRPSFEELLAKYKRKGATRKRKNQLNSAKGEKAPPRHEKRESVHHQKGNLLFLLLDHLYDVIGIILAITHLPIIVVCT